MDLTHLVYYLQTRNQYTTLDNTMPVTYLELENFKSYSGTQRIGPFFSFTCVIGPNGSGKSNLMDAISFILGVQSRDLRSSQMKDLIFRPPGSTNEELSAKASLVYVEPEEGETQEEVEEGRLSKKLPKGKTTIFSRIITTKGVGEYQINHKTVTFKQYEAKLASIGVLLKARNFLVFQGDVEAMARKSPKQVSYIFWMLPLIVMLVILNIASVCLFEKLVEMFENISGSAELKEEYDAALKAKEEAEQATIFAYNKTKEHKSERRQLKEQKVG